jgi:hypothetical protein
MPPKKVNKLTLKAAKGLILDADLTESPPNSPTLAGNIPFDSGESATNDLKQTIGGLLKKKEILLPLLSPLIEALLSSEEIMSVLVDGVFNQLRTKLLDEIKQEVYQSVRLDSHTNSSNIKHLEKTVQDLEHKKEELEVKLDDLEQYSRRNCLLVHGIPERIKEKTTPICVKILNEKLKLSLDAEDFDRTHRIGKPKTEEDAKPRPIIMKFVSYAQRAEVYGTKKDLKGSGVTITESLTSRRMEILHAANNSDATQTVWSLDGRIMCLNNNGKRVFLRDVSDVDNL